MLEYNMEIFKIDTSTVEDVGSMSEEQFAVMRVPERDGRHHTVPRLEVRDGQVSVSYDPAGDRYSAKFRKPGEKQS